MTQTQPTREPGPGSELSRRRVLRGAAVGGVAVPLLAACGGEETSGTGSGGSSSGGSSGSGGSGGSGGGGGVTVAASDVPVGGGTILKEDKIVVTQPAEGDFKAFDATCTHQGCLVSEVAETINCSCHGSAFSLEDGSPQSGPASAPLGAKTVTADGGQLSIS